MNDFDLVQTTPEDFDVAPLSSIPRLYPERAASQESIYTTLLSGNEDTVNTYQNVRKMLMQTGESELASLMRRSIADQYMQEVPAMVADVATDGSMSKEERIDTIKHIKAITPEEVDIEKDLLFRYNALAEQADQWSETGSEEVRRTIMDSIKQQQDEKGWFGDTTNFLGSLVPFSMTSPVVEVGKMLFGEDEVSMWDWINHAGLTTRIREHLTEMNPVELQQILPDILSTIKESAGTLSNNELIASQTMEDVLSAFVTGSNPYDVQVTDALNTMVNVLDAIAIGRVASMTVHGMGKFAGTGLATTRKTNPELTETLGASVLDDTSGTIAEALGVTKEQVLDHIMPKPDFIKKAVDDVDIAEQLKINQNIQDQIIELAGRDLGEFTAAEKASARYKFLKDLNTIEGIKLRAPQTTLKMADTGDGVIVKAIYGKADGTGFASIKEAEDYGNRLFGNDADFRFIGVNKDTKEMLDATAADANKYFIELVDHRKYNTTNIPNILKIEDGLDIKGLAKFGSWWAAPSARISSWLSSTGLRAFDAGKAVEHKLYEMINKPFIAAPKKVRDDVVRLLEKESDEGTRFSFADLEAMQLGTTEEVSRIYTAKAAINQMMDTIYLLNNERLYNRLTSDGYKTLVNHATGYKAAGKSIKEAEALKLGNVTVYNATTESAQRLSTNDIAELYARGGQLGRIKGAQQIDDGITDLVIVEGDTALEALTRYPLAYKQGYSTRYNDVGYVLIEKPLSGKIMYNGAEVAARGRAVHIANSKADAERLVKELNAKSDTSSYTWRHDRSFTMEERDIAEWQLNQAQGRLFFSGRGERLGEAKVATKGIINESSVILDPIESLQRTTKIVGNKVAMEDWVNSLKARFMNTYGFREFPSEMPKAVGDKVTGKQFQEAKALHQYIRMMEGLDDGGFAEWWRSKALSLGEWIAGNGDREWRAQLGKSVIKAGEKDILKRIRGLTFNILIAANPLRQMALQTQQVMFLAGYNPKYILSPIGMPKQAMALRLGSLARHTPEWDASKKAYAKMFGTTPDEFTKVIDEWQNSGLPYSIDAHLLGKDALVNISKDWPASMWGKIGIAPTRGVGWAVNKMKAMGFDWGEHNNLTFTWLAVRDRFIKDNPGVKWNSRESLKKINAESRALALSMTASDAYGYQKGWAATMMQFFSVQHKAWALLLPESIGGSKAVSTAMKKRMALGQAIMYGAGGYGLAGAYEKAKQLAGVEWDDSPLGAEIDKAIVNGLYEELLNNALTAVTGEDTQIALGNSQSPLAGMYENLGDTLVGIFEGGDTSAFDILAGPTKTTIGRFGDAIDVATRFAGGSLEDGDVASAVVESADEFLHILSGYSNATKFKAMMNWQTFVNKDRQMINPELKASVAEQIAQLIGYRSHKELKHWKAVLDIAEQNKAVKQDAEHIVGMIMKWDQAGSNNDMTLEELKRMSMVVGMVAKVTNDPAYQAALNKEVGSQLRSYFDRMYKGSPASGLIKIIMGSKGEQSQIQSLIETHKDQLDDATLADIRKLMDYMYSVEEE